MPLCQIYFDKKSNKNRQKKPIIITLKNFMQNTVLA